MGGSKVNKAVAKDEKSRREAQSIRDKMMAQARPIQSGSRKPKKVLKESGALATLRTVPFYEAPGSTFQKRWKAVLLRAAKENPELAYATLANINPFLYSHRALDKFRPATALYPSRRYIDIPIATTASGGDGRFMVALVPKLGDTGAVEKYQLYVAKKDALGWSSGDWSSSSNYLTAISGAGDIRVDENLALFATGLLRSGGYYARPTAILAASTFAQLFSAIIAGTDMTIVDNLAGIVSFPEHGVLERRRIAFATTGVYYFCVVLGGDGVAAFGVTTPTGGGGAVLEDTQLSYTSSRGQTGAGVSATTYVATHENSNIRVTVQGIVRVNQPGGYVEFTNSSTSGMIWVQVSIVSTTSPGVNAGLARTIRAVSAGLWVEWVGPMIENAGVISCALSPARGIYNLIGQTGSSPFFPPNFESYVQLQSGKDGRTMTERRLDKGCFATWDTAREDDVSLFGTFDSNVHQPPVLFAAGKYATSTGTLPPGGILRCHAAVNFEYESTSRAVFVDQNDMAYPDGQAAIRNLRAELGIPYCMENDLHDVATRFAQAMLSVIEFQAKMVGTAIKAAGIKNVSLGPLKLGFGGE
jgi:hypothetical protein